MSLTLLSNSEILAVSGAEGDFPATPLTLEQMFMSFLTTVSNEEMKRFIANNVHVNVQVLYYPQIDAEAALMC